MRKDVAKMAGVSVSTVTRALSGGYVSPSARAKVMSAIEALGYKPNALARALRTGRTGQIACVSPSIDNPFYSKIILGIEEIAAQHGYVLGIYSSRVMDPLYEPSLLPGRYDALILLSPTDVNGWLARLLKESHMPMAMFWDWGTESPYTSVTVNLVLGSRAATAHLFSQGHRAIGYLGYLPVDSTDANPRLAGFFQAYQDAEISYSPQIVELCVGVGTMEEGYAGIARLMRRMPGLTAIVASNDLLALGAMKWLREAGYNVPLDVSVIGCDDIPFASMASPALSTIQIPKKEVGNHLMRLILQMLADPDTTVDHIDLPSKLILRDSVAKARTPSM